VLGGGTGARLKRPARNNAGFTLNEVLDARGMLGAAFTLHDRHDVGTLRFCSMFA
jgi:hypothetical protein